MGRNDDGRFTSYRRIRSHIYDFWPDIKRVGTHLMAQSIGLVLAVVLTGYLFIALLFPERF